MAQINFKPKEIIMPDYNEYLKAADRLGIYIEEHEFNKKLSKKYTEFFERVYAKAKRRK